MTTESREKGQAIYQDSNSTKLLVASGPKTGILARALEGHTRDRLI
ncbi:hypothetical protein GALL_125390 [mine drainage metagenome]|uniref:Uncharacterized protein n=1 Tax=mine drainage metagenome TaxID=410659 RepID=A0A1J5SBA5_9ZZZZ